MKSNGAKDHTANTEIPLLGINPRGTLTFRCKEP